MRRLYLKGGTTLDVKYLDQIELMCTKIINKEIYYTGELVGILLTGSLAQECSHPNSDIDLHVIVDTDEQKIKFISSAGSSCFCISTK